MQIVTSLQWLIAVHEHCLYVFVTRRRSLQYSSSNRVGYERNENHINIVLSENIVELHCHRQESTV